MCFCSALNDSAPNPFQRTSQRGVLFFCRNVCANLIVGENISLPLTEEVEKAWNFAFFPNVTPSATPHPPRQARHLLLKGKAMRYSANKDVQFIMLSQLLIHRSAVPLLSQEKAKLCLSFGGWLVKKQGFLLYFNLLLKASHLPSLLQWEKVSRRRSDGWGVFYQMYTFFKYSYPILSLGKS